jgi:hypothetical protein
MRSRRMTAPALAAGAVLALITSGAGSASAHSLAATPKASAPSVTVLNDTVLAPYHLSASGGRLLVADGGTSTVSRVGTDGGLTTVATGPSPGGVAGLATGGGAVGYTSSNDTTGASTFTIQRPGARDVVADISGFEAAHNPDGGVHYGVEGSVNACQRKALAAAGAGVHYTGVVDSNAYSAAYAGHGWWYVGDAGGNDILKVSPTGHVSLLRVLPKQPVLVTAALAASNGLPNCVAGLTYDFEAVPTGLHVFGGRLYVSTLPGGLAAPDGSVYTMTLKGGGLSRLATGFLGATDVTVTGDGTVYVPELYAGQISAISNGRTRVLVSLPGALSVAYAGGHLYAGTVGPTGPDGNPTGPGSIVEVTIG